MPLKTSSSALPLTAAHERSRLFVFSAAIAGLLLLGIGGVLLAESIKAAPDMRAGPVDYIPGAAVVAIWIYYVQRPKTAAEVRWNCVYLVGLAIALVLVATAIKPTAITIILLYWSLAVLASAGAPVVILCAIIIAHQFVCARVATVLVQASSPSHAGGA